MIPRPQSGKRSDAVDAVLHCEGKPVRDCPRNCGGATGRHTEQEGFLINARVLIVRHRSVDSDHDPE
eukprot:2290711-Lingulodinium_polyedra.AAC.1